MPTASLWASAVTSSVAYVRRRKFTTSLYVRKISDRLEFKAVELSVGQVSRSDSVPLSP